MFYNSLTLHSVDQASIVEDLVQFLFLNELLVASFI